MSLFVTLPTSDKISLSTGSVIIDYLKGIAILSDGTTRALSHRIDRANPLRSVYFDLDHDANAVVSLNDSPVYVGKIPSGGFILKDISFDHIELTLSQTTSSLIIASTGLATASPAHFDVYINKDFSTTGPKDFTSEQTVFEIQQDTSYKVLNPWIDISSFTNGATITFQFYRATGSSGANYKKAGDAITRIVGTDSDLTEFSDFSHSGYTKITAKSNNAADNSVDVLYGYRQKNLE